MVYHSSGGETWKCGQFPVYTWVLNVKTGFFSDSQVSVETLRSC